MPRVEDTQTSWLRKNRLFSAETEIDDTAILKHNLVFVNGAMEEMGGRARYNVSFARVHDILILHDHKFARRMNFTLVIRKVSISSQR